MDNPLIFQILGVVLVLFVCFLTYMNTRVWRITHVMFAFLTFAACVGFLVYAALTLKTHSIWKSYAQKLEKRIEEEDAKAYLALNGNLEEIPQVTPSVRLLEQQIGREEVDRGLVWRDCTITGNDASGITLSTVPANLPAGKAPRPNHIKIKDKVHAFKELLIPELGAKVPIFYLGEFAVTAATDNTVTLTPNTPLDNQQKQEVANANTTWALYGTMPVDSQEVFAEMSEDQLRQMMPLERTALQGDAYEQFIKSFVRSGSVALDSDLPENKWVQVKFSKPYKVQVDGNSPGIMVIERNAFDQQGQAILPRLQRGGEVEFEPGTEALFFADDETVRQLIADETVKVVQNVFVRPLVDFELIIGHTFQRTNEINSRIKELNRDIASITASNASILKQIALKETEKQKTEEDLKYVKYEVAQLKGYAKELTDQVQAVKRRMSQIYTYNIEQEKNLTLINARLTEEINRRTSEATALNQG